MKIIISKNLLFLLSFIICSLGGIIYANNAERMYTSQSHVALFRLKIEAPDSSSEESRNRWIWIRDGLNIKSALITDEILENIIKTNKKAKEISKRYPNNIMMKTYLQGLINIQFTGGDENNYIVNIKAPSPDLAYELNLSLFNRIKYLSIIADQENFNNVINELRKKQLEQKNEPDSYLFYQEKIRKMIFFETINQKQRENTFQVISSPEKNIEPIWPNKKLIILASITIGLILGLSLEYFKKIYLGKK